MITFDGLNPASEQIIDVQASNLNCKIEKCQKITITFINQTYRDISGINPRRICDVLSITKHEE